MGQGFEVDLAGLHAAAEGISRTVEQASAHPVASLGDGAGALGHARLAAALATFCERWQAGVDHLVEDGRDVAARLGDAAAAYDRADVGGARGLDGVLRSPNGPDPGPR